MEGRSAVWLLAALLLEALISAEDQNSLKYLEVGGKLVLRPEPVSDPITSITWKFNGYIVGEWVAEILPLEFSPVFSGRASLDTTTGVLEIRNMMKNDSGVYTVEINNRIQYEGYDVRVIKQVPKNSMKYLEVGGKLVLTPEPVSSRVIGVTWRVNDDIVGEWDAGQELVYSSVFGGRAIVDKTTGVLEIRNMMKNESGVYTVEINNRIQSGGYDVRVIKQVSEPKAIMRPLTCSQSSKNCSLSCDGDVTEAGPVTFYFKKGDGDWEEKQQDITIMNDEDTQAVPTFSCRMENPLGQTDSEPVDNPFYVGSNAGKIAGIVVGVLAVVGGAAVAGGAAYHHKHADQPEEAPLLGQQP